MRVARTKSGYPDLLFWKLDRYQPSLQMSKCLCPENQGINSPILLVLIVLSPLEQPGVLLLNNTMPLCRSWAMYIRREEGGSWVDSSDKEDLLRIEWHQH